MKEAVVTIERLAFGGEGVGRFEGKVVFVPFTAPGDRVRIGLISEHERFDRGTVLEILEPSLQRVQPRCSVFGRCGGCQWQHLDYAAQLKGKEEILRDTLSRIGRIESAPIQPMIPALHPWNYRDRVQLQVDAAGAVGFHAHGSHEVVAFERCEIADERLNDQVSRLRQNGRSKEGRFEISVGEEIQIFTQVNPVQAKLLGEVVLDYVFGPTDPAFTKKWNLVELYCGAGSFTFPLTERAGKVFAVDGDELAIARAEEIAHQRNIENVEFIVGDAEWGLKKIYRKQIPIDTLVLDPPRVGAKEVMDLILLAAPRRIVYVSCDPATLARDLKTLVYRQYKLESVQPIDMFPQTYHVESVARLVRV